MKAFARGVNSRTSFERVKRKKRNFVSKPASFTRTSHQTLSWTSHSNACKCWYEKGCTMCGFQIWQIFLHHWHTDRWKALMNWFTLNNKTKFYQKYASKSKYLGRWFVYIAFSRSTHISFKCSASPITRCENLVSLQIQQPALKRIHWTNVLHLMHT